MGIYTVIATAALLLASFAAGDHCSIQTTCPNCIAQDLCGWCSVPVIYPGNVTGSNCAGFDVNGSHPFVCNGIYSTEQCLTGYECSSSGTCVVSPPGTGYPLAECQQMCHAPQNWIYACNHTTYQCYQVPPGTQGGTSLLVCQETCNNHTTTTPSSPGPVAPVYSCNTTTWTCEQVPAGHGASKIVCEETCQANLTLYECSPYNGTCYKVAPPNGQPLAACESMCQFTPEPTQPPNPNPPPEYIGIWRGVEIQNNYTIGEWDFFINISYVEIEQLTSSGVTRWTGIPYHIPNSPVLEFWIMITSGPGTGEYWRSIGDTSGERGPQTEYATIAFGAIGGLTPASITSAMTDGTSTVFAAEKCIIDNNFCIFTMAPYSQQRRSNIRSKPSQIRNERLALKHQKKASASKAVAPTVGDGSGPQDLCMQYGEACSVCLQHTYCGWCSVNVQYVDGVTGTQCAGFEGNHTPFVCNGQYSTMSCEVGYICSAETWQCVPTNPGDGMPLAVCQETCKATPPPPPAVPQYVCNMTTQQCSKCTLTECPGSMPLAQCQSACSNPHHGPTPDILGVWRGLQIQNYYPTGEITFVFNATGVTIYKENVYWFYASVISLGADVMLLTIEDGPNAGQTFDALYQLATEDFGMYTQMTFAEGVLGGSFPTNFDVSMYSTGMSELTLSKCLSPPCNFVPPS